MEKSNEIRRFVEKWSGHVTDEGTFADDCRALGFKMDLGKSLMEVFPDEELSSVATFRRIAEKITDLRLLGTAVFSYWRWRTHWDDYGGLDDDAQEWLKIAFDRMLVLLGTGSSPQKKYPRIMIAMSIIHRLGDEYCPPRANKMSRYFKAEPGGYGEGDHFYGVSNGICRQLVKEYKALPLAETEALLYDSWHEARLCGLLILVEQYKRGAWSERKAIVDLYIKASTDDRINNWDLVDLSAPGIVGQHELCYRTGIIRRFSTSHRMWKNRIAVVSTLPLIKAGEFDLTFELVKKYLAHPHDLMHKASGWMLREVGKKDQSALTNFLNEHRLAMPRTMLRYAIERYPEEQRRALLQR